MPQISKEAVAGVWPVEFGEALITRTFPSISSNAFGRFLGTLYGLPFPIGFIIHLATVPFPVLTAILMYLVTGFRRYQLTSLRVCVRRGIRGKDDAQVGLDRVDEVRTVVRKGQEYFRAGDLELVSRGDVVLTLHGVPTVEAFRQNILRARAALVQVRDAINASKESDAVAKAT
jgi:hypothetical protein